MATDQEVGGSTPSGCATLEIDIYTLKKGLPGGSPFLFPFFADINLITIYQNIVRYDRLMGNRRKVRFGREKRMGPCVRFAFILIGPSLNVEHLAFDIFSISLTSYEPVSILTTP